MIVLEIVAILAGHADLILLDGRLQPELGVLDDADDLARLLDGNALLELDGLTQHAPGRGLHLPVGEGLERHAAPVQLRLEDVDHRLELHVVGRSHGQRGLLDVHRALGALEVVASVDLAPGLVDGVGDLLRVDLADDVEGVLGAAMARSYRRGTVATPLGGVKVKTLSGMPLLVAAWRTAW